MLTDSSPARFPAWLLPVLLFSGLLVFYALLSWHSTLTDMLSDSWIYLAMAGRWSWALDFPTDLASFAIRQYPYPPGYPMLLAVLGVTESNVWPVFVFNSLAIAAVAVLGFFLARLRGAPLSVALLTGLLAGLVPVNIQFANYLASEFLFALLVMGAVVLAEYPHPVRARLYGVALLLGLALSVRTAGIALLPVWLMLLWRFEGNRWVHGGLSFLLLMLPVGVWHLMKPEATASGYGSLLWEHLQGWMQAGNVWLPLKLALLNLWLGWQACFNKLGSLTTEWVCGVFLLLLCLLALLKLALRGHGAALAMGAYGVMLLLWPFPEHQHRFLLPVLPVVLTLGLTEAGVWLARHAPLPGWVAPLPVLLCLLAVLPSDLQALDRRLAEIPPEIAGQRFSTRWYFATGESLARLRQIEPVRKQVFQAIRELPTLVPVREEGAPAACILTPLAEPVLFLAQRKSLRPAPETEPVETLRKQLQQCPYVFGTRLISHVGLSRPFYPGLMLQDQLQLLKRWDGPDGQALAALWVNRDREPVYEGSSRRTQ